MSESETTVLKEILGKTFKRVVQLGDDEIVFYSDAESYRFYHDQDCCESVTVDDVAGDLKDIEMSPITRAEETTKEGEDDYGTETWTFYKFDTEKGGVVIKWHGSSNGYYSESVYIEKIDNKNALAMVNTADGI